MNEQASLEQIAELCRTTWALRDRLLEAGAITPEIIRLEEAAHSLEQSINQLATALNARTPAGCQSNGQPRSLI